MSAADEARIATELHKLRQALQEIAGGAIRCWACGDDARLEMTAAEESRCVCPRCFPHEWLAFIESHPKGLYVSAPITQPAAVLIARKSNRNVFAANLGGVLC